MVSPLRLVRRLKRKLRSVVGRFGEAYTRWWSGESGPRGENGSPPIEIIGTRSCLARPVLWSRRGWSRGDSNVLNPPVVNMVGRGPGDQQAGSDEVGACSLHMPCAQFSTTNYPPALSRHLAREEWSVLCCLGAQSGHRGTLTFTFASLGAALVGLTSRRTRTTIFCRTRNIIRQ
ncbi:hypothetical protein T492DRAFT_617811 [Pavlovales sp. CCMP2436]|nr:hypothetical protein T492DRAFT_617811 [Pavlovales sp. CCMP2436]